MKNEEKEMQVVENDNYIVTDFSGLGRNTSTKTEVFTNITDQKQLFNLENNVNYMLNDCEGETIRVKDILIKRYEKPLADRIIDDATGEIIKDKEVTMSCVLVDEAGKSYATGSKTFTIQLMRFLQRKTAMLDTENFDIKIIKKKVGEKGNKALSFELV